MYRNSNQDSNNSSLDTAMAGTSGYFAFSGQAIEEALKYNGEIAKGTLVGKVFSITSGVITGVFDAQGNPDKSMVDVVGTSLASYTKVA